MRILSIVLYIQTKIKARGKHCLQILHLASKRARNWIGTPNVKKKGICWREKGRGRIIRLSPLRPYVFALPCPQSLSVIASSSYVKTVAVCSGDLEHEAQLAPCTLRGCVRADGGGDIINSLFYREVY